jgi:hypothetical protein
MFRKASSRRELPVETSTASALACPKCGISSRDPVEAQYGYCPKCKEFTGLCGAGRRIVCPDIMTQTSWHHPCTSIGVAAWELTVDTSRCVTLLCQDHDAQMTTAGTAWISHARRLTTATDPAMSSTRRSLPAGLASRLRDKGQARR